MSLKRDENLIAMYSFGMFEIIGAEAYNKLQKSKYASKFIENYNDYEKAVKTSLA